MVLRNPFFRLISLTAFISLMLSICFSTHIPFCILILSLVTGCLKHGPANMQLHTPIFVLIQVSWGSGFFPPFLSRLRCFHTFSRFRGLHIIAFLMTMIGKNISQDLENEREEST